MQTIRQSGSHRALQEQQLEKESIMGQYEQLIREREKVQLDQRPLMEESERIRQQLSEHDGKRTNLSVSAHQRQRGPRLIRWAGPSQCSGDRAHAGG